MTLDPLASPTPLVNLSEVLGGVPGLNARERQNYAQDLQLAVRGFGSRSTFGVRGVRLLVDGIPATMPDGQGRAATADWPTPAASRCCAALRRAVRQCLRRRGAGLLARSAQGQRDGARHHRHGIGRPVDGRRQRRRRHRRALRQRRCTDLHHRRLPRAQRGAPPPAQRQGGGRAGRRHARDGPAQCVQPAAGAGSAGAHARPGRRQPAPGHRHGRPVQHAQADRAKPGRRGGRAPAGRAGQPVLPALWRHPPAHPVPRHERRRAQLGRRHRRHRPQLRRRRTVSGSTRRGWPGCRCNGAPAWRPTACATHAPAT